MKIEELYDYNRIIAYDDDNHGVRIFINGIYIDDMDNRLEAAVHIAKAGQDCPDRVFATADIYLPEIEDDFVEKVDNLLNFAMKLTPEQEISILNGDFGSL